MVGLNPAKFYGRLLPRPRMYCDVKFSESRVDPPEPVNAAFLEWASEATWNMGGTATKRNRMSGKVEGRMNNLRNMRESDEDVEPPLPKKARAKLSFRNKKRSTAGPTLSLPEKHRTPIERMLESPGNANVSGQGKLIPRRIIPDDDETPVSQVFFKARRSRKEQPIPETDDDSDDDLEGFLQRLQSDNRTPTRGVRKSARLQASPTPSLTPDSKRPCKNTSGSGSGRKISRPSPLSVKRTRAAKKFDIRFWIRVQ